MGDGRWCLFTRHPSPVPRRVLSGDGGIRTLDTGLSPYNGLANRRLQPLGHVSKDPTRVVLDEVGAGLSIIPGVSGCVNLAYLSFE